MKQTINFYQFADAFKAIRPDNFSYDGLKALFEYLEEFEADTGEELGLDVVAICCDFSESTAADIANDYRVDLPEREDGESDEDYSERVQASVVEYLEYEGAIVADLETTILYRNF